MVWFWTMITKFNQEKNLLYCLEELRLLIENPPEKVALTERLKTIRDKLEELYSIHLSLRHLVVFFSQDNQD